MPICCRKDCEHGGKEQPVSSFADRILESGKRIKRKYCKSCSNAGKKINIDGHRYHTYNWTWPLEFKMNDATAIMRLEERYAGCNRRINEIHDAEDQAEERAQSRQTGIQGKASRISLRRDAGVST